MTLPWRKIIIFSIVGLAAFIFFGFFFPILILVPQEEERLSLNRGLPAPTFVPQVQVTGQEIIQGALTYAEKFPASKTIARSRCFKNMLGRVGKCIESETTDILPGYLVEVFEQAKDHEQANQVLNILISACRRDHAVCKASFMSLYRRYEQTRDKQILESLLSVGTELLSDPRPSFITYSQDVAKLAILFRLTGDSAYREEALRRAQEAKTVASADSFNPVIAHDASLGAIRRFDCGLYGSIYPAMYEITGDWEYQNLSKQFFNALAPAIDQLGSSQALLLCLDGARSSQNLSMRLNLLSYAIGNYWDAPQMPKFTSDNGFLLSDYHATSTNQILNFKYPLEHAWLLSHVIEFPDTTFNVKGSRF